MKKYYYLKTEVELGQLIDWEGLQVKLTQEIIDLNPDKFEVKEDIPEYFECINTCVGYTKGKIYFQENALNYPETLGIRNDCGELQNVIDWTKDYVKYDNNCFKVSTKEAFERQELLKEAERRYPKGCKIKCLSDGKTFTNDGSFKFGDMYKNTILLYVNGSFLATLYENGTWAEIIKDKTLEDYEEELLELENTGDYMQDSINKDWNSFISTLKEYDLTLYYTKILKLIAYDLNDGWKKVKISLAIL